MTGWLDTNGCEHSMHCFRKDEDGKPIVVHSDGDVCEHAEYKLMEDE